MTERDGGITFSGTATAAKQVLEKMWYTPTGKLSIHQDAAGNPTNYFYDPMDRVQIVKDPVGRRVASVYDKAGQTLYTWRGWNSDTAPTASTPWTPSTYSGTGPIRYAGYQYSQNGKQTQILDANNNITNLVYDGHDRLLYTLFTDPSSAASTCTVSASSVSGYDSIDPTCNTTLPHQQTYEKYAYYANGSQKSVRKRDGQVIAFNIDALGRETEKDLPGTTAGDVYYGYDLQVVPRLRTSAEPPASAASITALIPRSA